MRTHRIVAPAPGFDEHMCVFQGVEDLSIQKLILELTDVTPIWRMAPAIIRSCAVSACTYRSLATCRGIDVGSAKRLTFR